MLFNSFEYLLFFPAVAIIFFITPQKFRWFILLGASCFFYMTALPYAILFVGITVVNDYSAARLIEKYQDKKKIFLWQSLIINLGLLFIFKYYNFFSESISGIGLSIPYIKLILPIGLSFYTFKSIGYVIEVYRGEIKAERHLGRYALFVIFFLEIFAGPIDSGKNLLPQFYEKNRFDYLRIRDGLMLVMWGVFKKVVVADRLALMVNHVYGNLDEFSGVPLILTAVLFSFQIYFDFSGYTDIALGCGKILGFNLPENFNLPLISQSIIEFWRRWHISLSTWLRDYLFTPLAIATRDWGKLSVVFSLFLTFLLAGIWHGAGWTFIIFGALHGAALVYEFISKNFRKQLAKMIPSFIYDRVCNLIMFAFITFAFIFFRSDNISQAIYYMSHMFTNLNLKFGGYNLGIGQFEFWLAMFLIVLAMTIEIRTAKNEGVIRFVSSRKRFFRWGFYYAVIILIICFGVFGESSFVYFKF